MGRLKLKCCKCDNIMETVPGTSQDIITDEETGEFLYWNGPEYGYMPADCIICEKCREKISE
ncbi:MAG: hypothetical protein ACXADU_12285 [Promethearchaeota archaeon]